MSRAEVEVGIDIDLVAHVDSLAEEHGSTRKIVVDRLIRDAIAVREILAQGNDLLLFDHVHPPTEKRLSLQSFDAPRGDNVIDFPPLNDQTKSTR